MRQERALKLYDAVACLHSSLFPYTAGSIIRYKELKDNNYIPTSIESYVIG